MPNDLSTTLTAMPPAQAVFAGAVTVETGWQRADRIGGYVFFAVFAGGGMLVPLSFLIYSFIN